MVEIQRELEHVKQLIAINEALIEATQQQVNALQKKRVMYERLLKKPSVVKKVEFQEELA